MLRCGKYAGRSFLDVALEDTDYCAWTLRACNDGKKLPRDLRAFARYLREHHGGVLCVGKHKGKYFDEAIHDDPGYCEWAASLDDPGPALKKFVTYVREQKHTAESATETPTKKRRRRKGSTDGSCTICYTEKIDCVIVPCGHMCMCFQCAEIVDDADNRCPICRQSIALLQKTFLG